MTDRIKGLVVVFKKDIREDDCQDIVKAISMIKGVGSVELSVSDINDVIARSRIKNELTEKLWEVLK